MSKLHYLIYYLLIVLMHTAPAALGGIYIFVVVHDGLLNALPLGMLAIYAIYQNIKNYQYISNKYLNAMNDHVLTIDRMIKVLKAIGDE